MTLFNALTRGFRGVRVLHLIAATLLLVLAVGSYAFKTLAEAQGADTADVQGQVVQEERRIRLLKAEISHLEAPARIERLSTQYLGLAAVDNRHEIGLADLPRVAAAPDAPPAARPAP